MKILYLVSNPLLNPKLNTGYGRHIRETVHGLETRGHEAQIVLSGIFSSDEAAQIKTRNQKKESKFKRFLPSLVWETAKDLKQLNSDKNYIHRVEDALINFKPDIVYERAAYLSKPIILKLKYNLPWLVEVNSPFVSQRAELSGKSLLAFMAERVEQKRFAMADHVFCVSAALSRFISEKYRLSSENITVNHNGVDPSEFQIEANSDATRPFTIGFVGSIMPYHGLEKLMHAYARFCKEYPDSRLLIVGDGESLPDLRAMAEELNITNGVEFTGSIPYTKVKDQIDRMHVCVLPATKWYCSPVKMFEYAVMAKPIIAERIAPVIELIDHEKDGLLIGDEQELTNAMIYLLNHPEEAKRMAGRFKEKVLSQYTWQSNNARIETLMLRFVSSKQ